MVVVVVVVVTTLKKNVMGRLGGGNLKLLTSRIFHSWCLHPTSFLSNSRLFVLLL